MTSSPLTERINAGKLDPRDFLRRYASTELREAFRMAGVVCSFATNSERLLAVARQMFPPAGSHREADFSVRLWVEGLSTVDAAAADTAWPSPFVRGLGDLVFAGFDDCSSMLINLRTRRVIGRFSVAMSADARYWKRVIFPVMLSILSGTVGLVELHASCIAQGENGLALLGPSRSGKSTLAMALTQRGFRLISDDRIFCSLWHERLIASGLPRPLKLRSEAAHWFDDYRDREVIDIQRGERVFFCEETDVFQSEQHCEPRLLVFLEQQAEPGFCLLPIERSDALSRIEHELLAEEPGVVRMQSIIIDRMFSIPTRILRFGGPPQRIAGKLTESLLEACRAGFAGGERSSG
jgi:hypothetical protein